MAVSNIPKSSHSGRNIALIVSLISIVGIIVFAVPLIPKSFNESYYSIDTKQDTIASISDRTLQPNYHIPLSGYLPQGRDITFSVSASDTVRLYIFTSTQYDRYKSNYATTPNEKELLDISNGNIGYHISSSDTYYFIIYNPHTGLFGLGSKNVGIYSSSVIAIWQEQVIKYRTVTKTITIWQAITGSYS